MLEGGLEREPVEPHGFGRPPGDHRDRLGGPAAHEHLGELQGLGDVEPALDELQPTLELAGEDVALPEPHDHERHVGVGLVVGDAGVHLLEARDRVLDPPLARVEQPDPACRPCRRMRVAYLVPQRQGTLVVRPRVVARAAERRHLPGAAVRERLRLGAARELRCLFEEASRLAGGTERRHPLPRGRQRPPCTLTQLLCPLRAGVEPVGLDEVRRDHLCDLVLGEARGEQAGGGQMLLAPVTLCERVVGHLADQVLQEPVLAVLGRPRVLLQAEELLAHEAREQRLELRLGHTAERTQRGRA